MNDFYNVLAHNNKRTWRCIMVWVFICWSFNLNEDNQIKIAKNILVKSLIGEFWL